MLIRRIFIYPLEWADFLLPCNMVHGDSLSTILEKVQFHYSQIDSISYTSMENGLNVTFQLKPVIFC